MPDLGEGDVFLHVQHIAVEQDIASFIAGAEVDYEVEYVTVNGTEKPQARSARVVQGSAQVMQGEPRAGSVKFWTPQGWGFVMDQESGEEVFVHSGAVPQPGYLRLGDLVAFFTDRREGTKPQAVNVRVTGWRETGDPFSDELDMGDGRWAARLAGLAEKKEEWNYRIRPSKDRFTILRNYLKHTYLRQRELDGHLVIPDDQHLVFNTGLVTDFQEEIFALLSRRMGPNGPPWQWKSFEKASSSELLDIIGGIRPPLARYYETPEQLVYDTRLPLQVNVEHVPHDPSRFPDSLSGFSAEDLAGLVNMNAPKAVDRVRRNYKTAIPQYYRESVAREGTIQLLLPVGLVRQDRIELALAVDRKPGVYLGRTVLTLDWAYNNARLLTRPDTDWLQP